MIRCNLIEVFGVVHVTVEYTDAERELLEHTLPTWFHDAIERWRRMANVQNIPRGASLTPEGMAALEHSASEVVNRSIVPWWLWAALERASFRREPTRTYAEWTVSGGTRWMRADLTLRALVPLREAIDSIGTEAIEAVQRFDPSYDADQNDARFMKAWPRNKNAEAFIWLNASNTVQLLAGAGAFNDAWCR